MRSIYTIIQCVCENDFIDYSFWGLVVGLVTLAGGTGLAVYLYFRTREDIDAIGVHDNVIVSRPGSAGIEISD